jgi:hypothetical protein
MNHFNGHFTGMRTHLKVLNLMSFNDADSTAQL